MLISNDQLKRIYPLAIIIVMAYNYRPMYIGATMKVFYNEKTSLLWRVSFIAGVSNVILNFIFVPIYGFEAAAYTTFATLMYLGFAGYFIKAIKVEHKVNSYPLFWLSIIIALTILAYYSVEFTFTVKLFISIFLLSMVGIILLRFKSYFNAE